MALSPLAIKAAALAAQAKENAARLQREAATKLKADSARLQAEIAARQQSIKDEAARLRDKVEQRQQRIQNEVANIEQEARATETEGGIEPGQMAEGTEQERAAFWDMWMEHHGYLRKRTLRLLSGNIADADDVLSNAMLKASQKYAAYCGTIDNERAWLTRLVQNVCIDHFRSNQRLARWVDGTDIDDIEPNELMSDNRRTPEDDLVTREAIKELDLQLTNLPPKLREPLLMRFLQDMSYAEIAERLNLSNCAVRKRVQLAREILRQSGIR